MAACWFISACSSTPTAQAPLPTHKSPSVSTISVEDFSIYSPLTVEYSASITDSDQPLLVAALGSVVGRLLDPPTHQNSKNHSEQLAERLNDAIGPINNSLRLKYRLTDSLGLTGIQVDQDSMTTLQYRLKNRISEDGRTLELVTNYKVIDRSRMTDRNRPISANKILVQHRTEQSWTRDKLLSLMHDAVVQTANLIALDISGKIPDGSTTELTTLQGTKRYVMTAQQFLIPLASAYTHFSTPGRLIATSNNDSEPVFYQFPPCNSYC